MGPLVKVNVILTDLRKMYAYTTFLYQQLRKEILDTLLMDGLQNERGEFEPAMRK
jgi:hypothetical protein